jgi:hypothetical protein
MSFLPALWKTDDPPNIHSYSSANYMDPNTANITAK